MSKNTGIEESFQKLAIESAANSPGHHRVPLPDWIGAFFGTGKISVNEKSHQVQYHASKPRQDYTESFKPKFSAAPAMTTAEKRDPVTGRLPVLLFLAAQGICGSENEISEFSVVTFDCEAARGKIAACAGKAGMNLISLVNTQHYIVKKFADHHTGKLHVGGTCSEPSHTSRMYHFAFGKSTILEAAETRKTLEMAFDDASKLPLSQKTKNTTKTKAIAERDVIVISYDAPFVEGFLKETRPSWYTTQQFYQFWDMQEWPTIRGLLGPSEGSQIELARLCDRIGLRHTVGDTELSILGNAGNDNAYAAMAVLALVYISQKDKASLLKHDELHNLVWNRKPNPNQETLIYTNYPPGHPAPARIKGVRIQYHQDDHPKPTNVVEDARRIPGQNRAWYGGETSGGRVLGDDEVW